MIPFLEDEDEDGVCMDDGEVENGVNVVNTVCMIAVEG